MSSPDPQVRAARNPADLSSEPTAADRDRTQVTETSGPTDPLPGGRKLPAGAFEDADTPEPAAERAPRPVRGPVVAVTGAAGGVGALLTERLAASEEIKRVIAIDERRGECEGAEWQILDVRDPALAGKLRGVDVVVHLALDLDLESDPAARTAFNVRGTQTVLTAAPAAGVHRVVLCTSAMVYGALPDNELPLSEDAELRATAEATGVGDLLEIERLAKRAPRTHPGLNVTVVRPAVLVGGGTDTALTRYFESPRLLVVADSRPAWQFCHVEDLCAALEYAVLERVEGDLAVGCDGWLEQEQVEELSGIRRMELPSAVALGAAARLHRIGLTPSPAGDLAYTMYPWVVSGSRLHHAGWRPKWTNEEVLGELLEEVAGRHTVAGRRLGRKDATVAGAAGAAGATVALLGTAAIVRRARKARRRI
ncbi:SDR family oxidoreductase [Streptomyces koyangensis]